MFFCIVCTLIASTAISQPKAAFTSNDTKGCSPLVVQFSDASSGSPTQWKWDLGNGTISTQQNPSTIYLDPGTYTVKLIVSNSSGTDSIIKINYITVYAKPNVIFTATPTAGCNPLTVQFADQSTGGSGNILNEVWDFGDGQISTASNPLHTYIVSDTFSVTLSVSNSFGCNQVLQQPALIDVAPQVTADFDYNYTNACEPPTKVDFNNLSVSESSLTYQWFFGDGGTSIQANPSYTYNQNGNYQVKLIVRSDEGCSDTISKSISIGTVKPDFILPLNACVNSPLLFTNSSSPSPVSATWTFGDNGTSTKLSPTYTYISAGSFSISMTADFGTCTSTVTKTIIVLDKPKADFTATGILSTCAVPTTVQFNNNSSGAVSYKWLFGDGTSSTTDNPSHTYIKGGFFSVTLIAFNSNGCSDTITLFNLIKLGPPKITGIEGFPITGCAPQTMQMQGVINTPEKIVSYYWSFGDGLTSTDSTPVHTYAQAGSYTVRLIVITSGGCSDTLTLPNSVVLGTHPLANFTANPLNVCGFNPVNFTDLSIGPVTSWLWHFGDGSSSTSQNPTHQYVDTGYFNVTLIVENNGCIDSITFIKYIHVNPPIAKFVSDLNCSTPYTRNFTDKSIGAKTWNWDFGDGTSPSSLQNPSHTYTSKGNYSVKLTVTNAGCTDFKTDSIFIIDESPSFTYSPNDTILCKYDSVNFTVTNYNPRYVNSFYWDFGDGATSGFAPQYYKIAHSYNIAGTFTPVLIVRDILGCNDTISDKHLHFHIYGPTADFTNLPGTCVNGTIIFTDQSISDGLHPITKWIWTYGDGNSDILSAPPFTHTYNASGDFAVTLKLIDSYGCMDSLMKKNAVSITQPIADFSSSDSIRCTKNAITFNTLSSGLFLNYNWNFGDGNSSVAPDPVNVYSNQGIYSVQLLVTDKFGCKDSIIKPNFITISNPKASFILIDTFATCPPLLIQPNNTSSNYTSYIWDFGDGNTTNSILDPSHYYFNAGIYNLKLKVKGYGQCSDSSVKIIVVKGPSGNLLYSPLKACVPATITFTSNSKNATGFLWDFNNGITKKTTASNTTFVYDSYGSYLPKVILSDAAGCQVSIVTTDTLKIADVKAAILSTSKIYCDSSLATFNNASEAYNDELNSYSWNFGDGTSSTQTNPSHFYANSGTYNVSLTATTNIGCIDSVMMPVTIEVNKSPQITINAVDSACQQSPVLFNSTDNANDTASVVWQWNLGNGVFNNNQNATYTYPSSGVYNISLTAVDKYGCKDSASDKITILPAPVVDAGIDTTICLGNSVMLQASGGSSYLWNTSSSLNCVTCANPTANPDTTTIYLVKGSSSFGCSSADSVKVIVNQPFNITTSNDDTLCHGEKTVLSASGAGLFQWYPSTFLDNPKSAQPVFTAMADTSIIYTVIGTDNKNCFFDTGTVNVKVYPIPVMQLVQNNITLNVGSSVQLQTKNSPDVTQWRWSPATWLNDPTLQNPTATPNQSVTYTVVAANRGSCVARDQVVITVLCNNANIFVPNTFSPNNDGMNDAFYPRGKGLFSIKSLIIFNRWGQIVFEKTNFNANNANDGWNGSFQNKPMPSDVYVYIMDVICQNNTIYSVKGNVTLIR